MLVKILIGDFGMAANLNNLIYWPVFGGFENFRSMTLDRYITFRMEVVLWQRQEPLQN